MSENKTINTLLNAELPSSVENVLKNLSDKPSANIGTTLADIWYIIFGGISNYAEKKKLKCSYSLERFRQELEESISRIPSEKRVDPSLQVTAQALENAKYCIEEAELRDMFTSLISSSMNSDFTKEIHPSFAEIIKQMSVLDAKIIKKFKEGPFSGYPICNYVLSFDKGGYILLLENVFLELPQISLDLCSQSISSLERLGLIHTSTNYQLDKPEYYKLFECHPRFDLLKKEYPDKTIAIQRGISHLTTLGRSFIRVCVPD